MFEPKPQPTALVSHSPERKAHPEPPVDPPAFSDIPFWTILTVIGGSYILLIVALVVADVAFTSPVHMARALGSREIRFAIKLSLISCSITALLSVWVAVPLGYLLARVRFPGKDVVDAILDVPIVLPPLVIGLSLLILFQTAPGRWIDKHFPITYEVPAVILAQFSVACAFAVRTMRITFDQIPARREQVALTLGCTRSQAFWWVVLPDAWRGIVTAGTLAWARALGEFGPILVFAGATRMRTEVLSSTVFLELSIGNLDGAVAVSLLMVMVAMFVILLVRRPPLLTQARALLRSVYVSGRQSWQARSGASATSDEQPGEGSRDIEQRSRRRFEDRDERDGLA